MKVTEQDWEALERHQSALYKARGYVSSGMQLAVMQFVLLVLFVFTPSTAQVVVCVLTLLLLHGLMRHSFWTADAWVSCAHSWYVLLPEELRRRL